MKIILLIIVFFVFSNDSYSQTWLRNNSVNQNETDSTLIYQAVFKELLINDAAIYIEDIKLLMSCLSKVKISKVDSIVESYDVKMYLIQLVQDSSFANCYYFSGNNKTGGYYYFSTYFFDKIPYVIIYQFYNTTYIYRITGFSTNDAKALKKDNEIEFDYNRTKLNSWIKSPHSHALIKSVIKN
jgi:hypothetical protein